MSDGQKIDKIGYLIMDGDNKSIFGTHSMSTLAREVIHKLVFDLPKKQSRGEQTASDCARLRKEKQQNYVTKTAELAAKLFIDPTTSQPNVTGISIIAPTELIAELGRAADMFNPNLKEMFFPFIDEDDVIGLGFKKEIELSADCLSSTELGEERKLLRKYFEEVSEKIGNYVFGVEDTLKALKKRSVEILIVWEDLDIDGYLLKYGSTGKLAIQYHKKKHDANVLKFRDKATSAELEVLGNFSLLEWLFKEYANFGCSIEFITGVSREGRKFCREFDGIGGILRKKTSD